MPSTRTVALPLLLALTAGQAVHAAETEVAVARCAAVKSNLERLTCYDALARELAPPDRASQFGKWRMQISQNPFDDSTTVLLMLGSDSGTTSAGEPVDLVLRCESGEVDAYIEWDSYLGTDETELRQRIGDGREQRAEWQISTDNRATFRKGNPRRFIEALLPVERFVAQVVPVDAPPIRAEWDLRGLEQAIEPLQRTCS